MKARTIMDVALVFLAVLLLCMLVTENHVSSKCENAYNNYFEYMNGVNQIAIENGFGPQHIDTLQKFCEN